MAQVSFIIAAFNAEHYIEACVYSCFQQTYENIEVVVIDDGSIDGTWDKLKGLKKKFASRLIIDRFEENRGKVAAFNRAFRESSGEFIAISCADDISLSDRIEFSMKQISEHELLCGDQVKFDDASGQVLSESMMEEHLGIRADGEYGFNELLERPIVYGGTIFSKRKALNSVFPVDEKIGHEDWWIPLCLSVHKKIKYCHKVLCRYRVHFTQSTGIENRFSSFAKWRTFRTREIPYYEKVLKTFDLDDRLERIIRERLNREQLADKNILVRLNAFISMDRKSSLDFFMIFHPYVCYWWMKRKLEQGALN